MLSGTECWPKARPRSLSFQGNLKQNTSQDKKLGAPVFN